MDFLGRYRSLSIAEVSVTVKSVQRALDGSHRGRTVVELLRRLYLTARLRTPQVRIPLSGRSCGKAACACCCSLSLRLDLSRHCAVLPSMWIARIAFDGCVSACFWRFGAWIDVSIGSRLSHSCVLFSLESPPRLLTSSLAAYDVSLAPWLLPLYAALGGAVTARRTARVLLSWQAQDNDLATAPLARALEATHALAGEMVGVA